MLAVLDGQRNLAVNKTNGRVILYEADRIVIKCHAGNARFGIWGKDLVLLGIVD
jgi:ATP phosphoribosyltransferase